MALILGDNIFYGHGFVDQLANVLKPVVLPGESMSVFILKEGKEYTQGVAYLDDGTMVVVEQGRSYIGQDVTITVTSVLQTPAGRMIFVRIESRAPAVAGGVSGGGQQRGGAD